MVFRIMYEAARIGNTRTHENEDAISVFLPTLDHPVVFFLCSLGIHGEEGTRAVTKDGFWL
jgi:hypothetical protein